MQQLSSLRLSWPTNWAEIFGIERPLIVEIGFGYGAFLVHLARQNPMHSVIGLEIANQCLTAAERAITRYGLRNVQVVHSTAETALHHLFEPESISQLHINFPDPWFKKRHSHRRLMQRDTLDAMVSRLQPGGLLYLATDIVEYAEMSAELLAQTPGLDNLQPSAWTNSMPGRVVTKYEGRAVSEGRPCYYFAYRRNELAVPDVPVMKERDMTHVVFSSPLSLDDMLAGFESSEHKLGDTVVSLLQGYRGRNVLLFEVFIKEPTIDQHVALVLSERETENEYTLKVGTLGYPRSTMGMHRAVELLADHLVGLSPQARVLKHKLKES